MSQIQDAIPEQVVIQETLEQVMAQKEMLRASIKKTINEYWDWFNAENTNIAKLRRVGMTDLNVSNISPVLESRQSGESTVYYILWKSHPSKFRKNIKKFRKGGNSASIPLHKNGSLNIKTILKNKCTWDAKKAVAYESHFEYMRVALKGAHEAEVRLRSASRKIQKIANNLTESQSQQETHYD